MKHLKFLIIILFSIILVNCKNNNENPDEETVNVTTPVTVTKIQSTSISEKINMNAVSTFQKKSMVKSNINGYIEKVFVNIGDYVEAGTVIFILKTKEAEALNSYNKNDSTFKFKGELAIKAPTSGVISEVTKQLNDYVSDGDQLCIVAEQSSFVFLLSVPFELNKYVITGTSCDLLLPDSTSVKGTIISKLSTVDAVSQTQSYIIKPQTNRLLPENLLATVQIIKSTKQNTQVVDKDCVLSDETMDKFWVMKLINDSTALKISIKKGITTDTKIEILSPQFSVDDRLISSGNYGLPDTAFIKIIQN